MIHNHPKTETRVNLARRMDEIAAARRAREDAFNDRHAGNFSCSGCDDVRVNEVDYCPRCNETTAGDPIDRSMM